MKRVDYDAVAEKYDGRYDRNWYQGVVEALRRFVGAQLGQSIAEVGCGTGRWLAELSSERSHRLAGLDYSRAMLQRARMAAPAALLVRGTAERLPWADASFDRVFSVNALHHFFDARAFIGECRRVLCAGGGLLTIGLDPHTGVDRWWVYDFFPAALEADRQRYASTPSIRAWLEAAGFRECATEMVQHLPAAMTFENARERGFVDRNSTSQLMVISDDDYDAGMKRLLAERPVLRADLRIYATSAWDRGLTPRSPELT
jgi:ubiquinone/menaquinone biosynthesis C-methylase UbiE